MPRAAIASARVRVRVRVRAHALHDMACDRSVARAYAVHELQARNASERCGGAVNVIEETQGEAP